MQGIYCIENKVDNKKYVGSSKNITRRLKYHHKSLLKSNKHWNGHLQSAWNKYGSENFEFYVLEEVIEENNLTDREQHWMDLYNVCDREFGYNLAPKADRSGHSPETIEKMKISRKGKPSGMLGKKHSKEALQKISEAGKRRKGMKFSDEHRANISAHQKGRSWEERMGKEKADLRREIIRQKKEERDARKNKLKTGDSGSS